MFIILKLVSLTEAYRRVTFVNLIRSGNYTKNLQVNRTYEYSGKGRPIYKEQLT